MASYCYYFYIMKGLIGITLALMLLLLIGCRTEEAVGPVPDIKITEPYENQSFGFGDTVVVKANITNKQALEYVRIAITDSESSPVMPVQMFYPVGQETNIFAMFVLNNLLTETGIFSVNVRTSTANGITNEWKSIYYTAAPKSMESLLVVTKKQVSGYAVKSISSTGQISERFSFSGDYSGSAVCSRHQMFFKAGSVFGNLAAWNLRINEIGWSIPAVTSPPLPYFTAIYSDNNEVFVSTRDAFVSGYSAAGINTFRSRQYNNGYFTYIARQQNWLVAVYEPFNSTYTKLVIFNYPGGSVFREIEFTGKVSSINDFGKDGLLLFVNENSLSAVYNYNFELNALVKLKDFPPGNIRKVSMPEVQDAFLAFSDGIYWYRPSNGSFVKVLSVSNAVDIAYEPISGKLFVASADKIEVFVFPEILPVASYSFDDDIINIHVLYNK